LIDNDVQARIAVLREQIARLNTLFNPSVVDLAELQLLEQELDALIGKYVVIVGIFVISAEVDIFTLYLIDDHDIRDIDYYARLSEQYLSVYFEGLPVLVESISSIRRTNIVEYSIVSGIGIAEFEEIGPKRPRSIHSRHGRRHLTKRYIDIDNGTWGYVE
jgi:hypothetical protein